MKRKQLVLDRYEIMGTAGSGGFGTVQIAWDPRIQRKVAIKTIQLTERDAQRAALSGAQNASSEDADVAVEAVADTDTDAQETILLEEEERMPQKALSPAEARTARAAAEKEAEEERRALSLSWENPWVKIPDDVAASVTEVDLQGIESYANAEAVGPADLADPADPASDFSTQATGEIEVAQGLDSAADGNATSRRNVSQALSASVPSIVQIPEVGTNEKQSTQELVLPEISADTTAEIPAIAEATENDFAVEEVEIDVEIDEADTSAGGDAPDAETVESSSQDNIADSVALNEEDDYVNPTMIISEARDSLQNLDAPNVRGSWDGHLPWEDPVPEPDTYKKAGSDEPLTTLVHVPGLDEARTAAKLSDQRIVTVYDFEVRDQTAYLIMEYVEGITLSQLLDDYPNYITLDMVTSVFDAVAGALEVAHDTGVLHLDIKPDNIIINKDGQVKVTDFGLATLADAAGHGFAGGGTIGYMPLEQMRREELDVRTDEWALAAMTYEMLTGGNPFRARTLDQAQQAILNAELVLPSLCWPRVDSQLDDVLFYALDPDREERYESIEDFADEVDKFLGDPDSGQEQLALVVEDALSQPEPEPEPEPDSASEYSEGRRSSAEERTGVFGLLDRFGFHRPRAADSSSDGLEPRSRTRFLNADVPASDYPEFAPSDRLAEKLGKYGPDDALYEEDYYEDEEEELKERRERIPLFQRVPDSLVTAGARLWNGIGCAFVTGLAFWNFEPIRSIPDEGAYIGAVIGAIIFGLLGAIVPTYGALVSFCLLGIVICLCGHPIVGAVLIIVTGLWWYIVGRDGVAENNISLLGPVSMSVGAAPITPLFAGASLKPLQAIITVLFSVIVVCIFSALGGSAVMGWENFGMPTISNSDATLAFARMFTRPLTYTTAAGWIAGAALFSLLNMKSSRLTFIIGLVLCVACVLVGALVFMAPTPQLIVSVIAGAAVLLAVFV